MDKAKKIIESVAAEADRVILFHSATGKDSIALLDLVHPYFKEIVCVFMYTIKGLEHIQRYISWAQRKYPKARFIQIPHYGVYSYIKVGFMGCDKNPTQRLYSLADLNEIVRERTGIEWTILGFKQSDSMNRRLMLRGYEDSSINRKTKKAYPLSEYKNADVMHYIEENGLIRPEAYGGEYQSSGSDINDIHYLCWLEKNYPNDLRKVFGIYPMAERLLWKYHNQK